MKIDPSAPRAKGTDALWSLPPVAREPAPGPSLSAWGRKWRKTSWKDLIKLKEIIKEI